MVSISGHSQSVVSVLILSGLLFIAVNTSSASRGTLIKRPSQQISDRQRLEAEQRLWDLGYWAGPVDGKFDSASRHALFAFQKVEGRARTGKLTWSEFEALKNASRPNPLHSKYAHVEIDLQRQVLFIIDSFGTVVRILPVSTGNGKLYMDQGAVHRAITPTGTFKVSRKINGPRISTLGFLYYPNYIVGGVAIHGSPSVPPQPASHGCIRIPMFAAKEFSQLTPVGTEVMLYD
jgi:hypothetical protein